MNIQELETILRETLEDHKLSRGEKKALKAWFEAARPDAAQLDVVRAKVFDIARAEVSDPESPKIIEWLEGVVKLLAGFARDESPADGEPSAAFFTPENDCASVLAHAIRSCRKSCDVCVFTITDNRLADALLEAHGRGVAVRIVTDDDKAGDLGSDIGRLTRAGIEVRPDRSEHHMHHKFALFDDRRLVTGSYNWTRGAALNNEENFIVTGDAELLRQFRKAFEAIWQRWA